MEISGELAIGSRVITGNWTVRPDATHVQGRRVFIGGDFECEVFRTEGPVIIGATWERASSTPTTAITASTCA